MKTLSLVLSIVLVSVPSAFSAEGAPRDTGTIEGRISPQDVSVRIIAKIAGTEHKIKKNVKGEVTLSHGGEFAIKGLPEGKYDLLFFLQGKSEKKYFAWRWSEIVVRPGKATSGINYRLTPQGSEHLVDEVLVTFKEGTDPADVRKAIKAAGCIIKDEPIDLGSIVYTLDIPDNKSVEEMLQLFKANKQVESAEPNGITTVDTR